MYPDRLKDGYGLKNHHLDQMKEKNVDLVITVDNGITSVQEALYAKELGLDFLITDHHHQLDAIPEALAVVNPQVSPDYACKGICGAAVVFKVICALMEKSSFSSTQKKEIFEYMLPIVSIATVADCVPLIDENRVLVKRGLEIINRERHKIPPALDQMLKFLKITTDVESYHIGFVIGPRINA